MKSRRRSPHDYEEHLFNRIHRDTAARNYYGNIDGLEYDVEGTPLALHNMTYATDIQAKRDAVSTKPYLKIGKDYKIPFYIEQMPKFQPREVGHDIYEAIENGEYNESAFPMRVYWGYRKGKVRVLKDQDDYNAFINGIRISTEEED